MEVEEGRGGFFYDGIIAKRHQEPSCHVVDHDTRNLGCFLRPSETSGELAHVVAGLHGLTIAVGQGLVLSTAADGDILKRDEFAVSGLCAGFRDRHGGAHQCRFCSFKGRSVGSCQLRLIRSWFVRHVVDVVVCALLADDVAVQGCSYF